MTEIRFHRTTASQLEKFTSLLGDDPTRSLTDMRQDGYDVRL